MAKTWPDHDTGSNPVAHDGQAC